MLNKICMRWKSEQPGSEETGLRWSEGSSTFILNCCLRHKDRVELQGRGWEERERRSFQHPLLWVLESLCWLLSYPRWVETIHVQELQSEHVTGLELTARNLQGYHPVPREIYSCTTRLTLFPECFANAFPHCKREQSGN